MRHLGQERHVPPDTSGPASLRLAQLPRSPPPARNVERRNRLLDPLIRVELRVCPGTSCGIAEPSQHEADRGKAKESERLAVEVLPILGQSTAAVQPSYGAFDNPALREDDKPFRLIRALHDFKVHAPQDLLDRTSELRSVVSAIGV